MRILAELRGSQKAGFARVQSPYKRLAFRVQGFMVLWFRVSGSRA